MDMSMLNKFEDKMNKTIVALENDYNAIRAGRANPHILDRLTIDYYGTPTSLQQVANVSIPEARILQIQPWDMSIIKLIERAILTSDIGINPNSDGKVIRLIFPELTTEKRKEITKDIKKHGENAKVAIRNIRRDALDEFKKQEKDGNISEDDLKNVEKKVQNMTDKFIKNIDTHIDSKSNQILSI